MALDTTIGGDSAESYVSVTEADTYWQRRGNSAWASATESIKEGALVRATQFLDARYSGKWIGAVANLSQALAWPRCADIEADPRYRPRYWVSGLELYDEEGRPIPSDAIPRRIKDAVCELALRALSVADLAEDAAPKGTKVEQVKAGAVETRTEYTDQGQRVTAYATVQSLVRPYTTASRPLVRT